MDKDKKLIKYLNFYLNDAIHCSDTDAIHFSFYLPKLFSYEYILDKVYNVLTENYYNTDNFIVEYLDNLDVPIFDNNSMLLNVYNYDYKMEVNKLIVKKLKQLNDDKKYNFSINLKDMVYDDILIYTQLFYIFGYDTIIEKEFHIKEDNIFVRHLIK